MLSAASQRLTVFIFAFVPMLFPNVCLTYNLNEHLKAPSYYHFWAVTIHEESLETKTKKEDSNEIVVGVCD